MNYLCVAITSESSLPTTLVFRQKEIRIGRSSSNDITFDPVKDGVVSRHHATIQVLNGRYIFQDLNSTQGSYLGKARIDDPHQINSGDVITLGKNGPRVHFLFQSLEDSSIQSLKLLRSHSPFHFPLALYDKFPATFQEYQKIGEGGYGQVWVGRRRGGNTWTAIKFLRPELLISSGDTASQLRVEKIVDRFKREFRVMKELAQNREKGMIKIYKIGGEVENGFVYMTMEYIRGQSLDKIITEEKKLPDDNIYRYLYQLARTLDYIHNFTWQDEVTGNKMKGIIHRDIKPSNILIRESNNSAYLCDFGIAAIEEGGTRLTMPKMRVFTSKYSAPEAIRNNTVTPASDLWGLAVVSYILFSAGYFPYNGNDLRETLDSIENNSFISLGKFNQTMNPQIKSFIERALKPDPEVRPKSAREWMDILSSISPTCTNSFISSASEDIQQTN